MATPDDGLLPGTAIAEAVNIARREALIALAADSALRRALQIRRPLPLDILLGAHEAGHTVVALAMGQSVVQVSIDPDHGGLGGHTLSGPPGSKGQPLAPFETDRRRVIRLTALVHACPTWRHVRRTIRHWRAQTDLLVAQHWQAIMRLTGHLCERRTMAESEILATVGEIPARYPEGEIELQVLVAGDIGVRLALLGESPGWRRLRRPTELRAIHESSHVIVAAIRGRAVYGATIRSDSTFMGPHGQFSGGQAWTGGAPKDQSPAEIERRTEWAVSDARRAAALSLVLTPNDGFPCWRGALLRIRAAQRKAAGLLAGNWPVLMKFAEQLERRGTLTANDIAQLLGRA